MRQVFSHFNPPVIKGEYNSGVSITQPDCSMSIEDIIESFREGVILDPSNDTFYDAVDDGDDVEGDAPIYDDVFDAMDAQARASDIPKEKVEEESKETPVDEEGIK